MKVGHATSTRQVAAGGEVTVSMNAGDDWAALRSGRR